MAQLDNVLTGYVMLPDENQSKAKDIEIRITNLTKMPLCSFTTEENGRFQRTYGSNGQSISFSGCAPIPTGLKLFFYVKVDGYQEYFEPMTLGKSAGNIIALLRGPNDGLDTTRRELPPLTPVESLRKELVDQYGELAVRYYEAALRDKLKNNRDKAIENFSKAVKASAKFFDAYVELGTLLHKSKQITAAEQALRKALDLRPGAGPPAIELGTVLLDKANALLASNSTDAALAAFAEAAAILKPAVQRVPWSSDGFYYLGSAQYKLNQLDDAEASLKSALELPQPRQDARLMLVNVYIKQKRYTEALDQLNAYLDAVPDGPQRAAALELRDKLQKQLKSSH